MSRRARRPQQAICWSRRMTWRTVQLVPWQPAAAGLVEAGTAFRSPGLEWHVSRRARRPQLAICWSCRMTWRTVQRCGGPPWDIFSLLLGVPCVDSSTTLRPGNWHELRLDRETRCCQTSSWVAPLVARASLRTSPLGLQGADRMLVHHSLSMATLDMEGFESKV